MGSEEDWEQELEDDSPPPFGKVVSLGSPLAGIHAWSFAGNVGVTETRG